MAIKWRTPSRDLFWNRPFGCWRIQWPSQTMKYHSIHSITSCSKYQDNYVFILWLVNYSRVPMALCLKNKSTTLEISRGSVACIYWNTNRHLLHVLGKDGFNNSLSYGVVTFPSLSKDPLCKYPLFIFLSSLYKSCVQWSEVLHPSDFLQSLLHLTIVVSASRGDSQLKKGNFHLIIPRFW